MLVQLQCLIKACDELDLSYRFYDNNHNVISVKTAKGDVWFANSAVGINSDTDNNIAVDKFFTYSLLKTVVNMPKTSCFVDPFIREKYSQYAQFKCYAAIADEIMQSHILPCIIKPTRGTHGVNVFACSTKEEVLNAVTAVLDPRSKDYDYTVLAQEYIKPHKEYRIVMVRGKILFIYEKDLTNAVFKGNLSPLHWEDAKAVLVKDKLIISNFQKVVDKLYAQFPIAFAGLDIIIDNSDKKYLLEVNSRPGFKLFIDDNGDREIVDMYKNILI